MKLNNTVMFVCNQGGHFSQMLGLSELFSEYESVLVTDNVRANKKIEELKDLIEIEYPMAMAERRKELSKKNKATSSRWDYFAAYIKMFKECDKIWNKYSPKVIITTGSNIAVPFAIIAKIKGSKFVFIETRAKVFSKTITGKIVEHLADKIIVQWPEMVDVYKGKAQYYGTLV